MFGQIRQRAISTRADPKGLTTGGWLSIAGRNLPMREAIDLLRVLHLATIRGYETQKRF
jgi:hypothetical protein